MTTTPHGREQDRRFTGVPIPQADETKITIPIIRPKKTTGWIVRFIILSDDLLGLHTHYASRTVPCGFPDFDCKYCTDGKPKTWRGYLAVYDCQRKTPAIAELPPAAARQLADRSEACATLRSTYVELERTSERDNAPVRVKMFELYEPQDGSRMPAAFDLVAQLTRIWKCDPLGSDSVATDVDRENRAADEAVAEFNAQTRLDEKTNGNSHAPKVYETTQSQRDMLEANRAALSVKSGEND